MIRRKFRSQQLDGKLIKLPELHQQNPDIVLLTKDDKQNYPKIIRLPSQSKSPSLNDSFSSGIRNKLIRDVYTPSQGDLLNRSIRKLSSSTSKSRQNQQQTVSRSASSSRSQGKGHMISSIEQVKIINRSFSQDKSRNTQLPTQTYGLQSLSKLVNYNLYRKHSASNRQTIYDKARPLIQPKQITNPSLIKIKNMHSTTSSTSSVPTAVKKSASNRIILTDRKNLVEVNGNSISGSPIKNTQQRPQLHIVHTSLPYIKTQSAASSIQQRKKIMFRNESVQAIKNNGVKQNNPQRNGQLKSGQLNHPRQQDKKAKPGLGYLKLTVGNQNHK